MREKKFINSNLKNWLDLNFLARNFITSFKVKFNQDSLACAKASGFSISFELLYISFAFAKAAGG